MTSSFTRRLRVPAAALTTLMAAPALAGAQDGVTFTYRVQSASTGAAAQGEATPNLLATVRAAGSNMRLEFQQGGLGAVKSGGYMLIRGADRTFVIVSPKDKSAIVMDAQGLGSGAGAATNNAIVKVAQKDAKFDFEDLGAGGKILGYDTRRVRMTSSATTEMRILGKTTRTSDATTGESWIATRLQGVDPEALRQWGQAFGRGLQRTNADLVPRLADYEKQYGNGIALRSVMVTQTTDDKGTSRTDTLRMEVTQLTPGRLDKAIFEVPADYEVADMRQVAAALDSARKANGLDTVDMKGIMKEAGKESTKDAVKGALGGFLKRKKP